METCIICKSKIDNDTHLIIMSNKIEHHFYSKNCVNKFVENPNKYLAPVKFNYGIGKIIKNIKKNNARLYLDQIK